MRNDSIADREPCPWRIVDDIGGAFCMGAIGGGIFHSIKGSINAPSGARINGSLNAMSARAPILGGGFAVWGGLFACCDCSLTALRQKEDPWNSIISGAATGGVLAARAGPKAIAQAAVVGGTLLALIEGMGIMFTKMMSPAMPSPEEMAAMGAVDPTAPPTAGGMMLPSSTAPPSAPSSEGSSSVGNPFDILAGGGGENSSSDNSSGRDFDNYGSETTFSSGASSSNEYSQSPNQSKGWWPFGAGS